MGRRGVVVDKRDLIQCQKRPDTVSPVGFEKGEGWLRTKEAVLNKA